MICPPTTARGICSSGTTSSRNPLIYLKALCYKGWTVEKCIQRKLSVHPVVEAFGPPRRKERLKPPSFKVLSPSVGANRMIVAVTGGGRGIGRNIVKAFQDLGDTVISIDRKADQFNTDLSHPYAGKLLIQEIIDKHGRIDVLVNNARSHLRSLLGEENEEDWDQEMAVNLKSAYFLGKYAIEHMSNGAIVNIGSVTTNFASHESAAYQISKGACLSLTRCLAMLGAPKDVTCNAVLPGFIVQDEYRVRYEHDGNKAYRAAVENMHPLRRPGTSDEVAQATVFLAKSKWITGTALTVDGGLTMQELAAFKYKSIR